MLGGLPDAMSDVLSLVRMRSELVCSDAYSAPWSFSFGRPVAHFHILERGNAWLTTDDGQSTRLEGGDLVILPLGTGHVLSSDPSLRPVPIEEALARRAGLAGDLRPAKTDATLICGQFVSGGVLAPKLLAVLPRVIHLEGREERPLGWLRLTSDFLIDETRNPRPGSAIMVARLLDLLFFQAIRQWGAKSPSNLGWLSGLSDLAIGRALSAIHEEPARRWTVEALAARAGLSRSAFAARFAETVGQTPLRYLAIWRLDLAADQLRAGTAKIGEIATAVGYGSEAALTRAFKAQFGTTPAAFRRDGKA